MSEPMRNCPFCDGNAVECFTKVPPADMSSNAWAEGYVVASIACGRCGARGRQYSLDTGSRTPTDHDVKNALVNAAIQWSARVNPPELTAAQARVAELEKARLSAMVLVYEPELTHSVWQDYGGLMNEETGEEIIRSQEERINDLKAGVLRGEWVAWRLIRIEKEVMGNE